MRQGLRALLEMNANFEVCGEARNGIEAVELAVNLQPNVVILDISMPGMDGLDAAREIRKKVPETQILILTVFDSGEAAGFQERHANPGCPHRGGRPTADQAGEGQGETTREGA